MVDTLEFFARRISSNRHIKLTCSLVGVVTPSVVPVVAPVSKSGGYLYAFNTAAHL